MEVERFETQEEVRDHIKHCEGKHTQQVCYSTYHDALTQICFDCNKVRTNLTKSDANRKKNQEIKNVTR